jgi:predicted metal-binding membrane protein
MKMQDSSVLEAILRRDRLIVTSGMITVVVLAWMYLLMGAGMSMDAVEISTPSLPWLAASEQTMSVAQGEMTRTTGMGDMMHMAHMAMMWPAVWTPGYALLMGVMWWVMMIAMMLPSASPMLLLFARVNRAQKVQEAPFVPTSVFAAGYLVVWGAFSLVATSLQWGLERLGLLSTMMASTSALFGGVLLMTAGVYQLTPFKHACLRHCRNPFQFVTHHWRTGTLGAFRMGIEHGAFCVACCWFLMSLLLVGGVMNLYWIVGLAILVLLEKTLPTGHWLGAITGGGLILWGGWMAAGVL